MINILIKTDSHYRVNRENIRQRVEKILAEKRVKGNIEVSINIVGDRMMRKLNLKYRNIDETSKVLSFPLLSADNSKLFVSPPDNVLHLGDIVISYPKAIDQAVEENQLVDDIINELVIHGMKQLLGNNHDQF